MKKYYSFLFLLLLSIGIITGCGKEETTPVKENDSAQENKAEEKEEAAFPVTIKDAVDKEVVIEAKPERIVSLIPSNTEIIFELGLGKEVVAVTDYDNYPEETATIEKIGGQEINVEKILSLNPDLVVGHASWADAATDALQQIRDAGIPVLVVNDAQNFDQVYDSIAMIGTATGEQDEAERIITSMKTKLEDIKTKAAEVTEKKKVFIEVSPEPEIYTTGANTFMNEMLTSINAENIAADQEGWIKVDQEAIIEKNPDVIITTYGYYSPDPVGQVTSREAWQEVNAVKNKQVVDVHSDLVSRTGPRLVEGVEALAKAVYPDIFE